MTLDHLNYLWMIKFGVAIVIYLGIVSINGSFNINNWNIRCDYNKLLYNWKTLTFMGTLYFFDALTMMRG